RKLGARLGCLEDQLSPLHLDPPLVTISAPSSSSSGRSGFDSRGSRVLCMRPVAGLSRVETALGEHRRLATTRRETLVRAAFGLGALLLVVTLGGANGGYFPTAWNWSSLALLWLAAMALLVR